MSGKQRLTLLDRDSSPPEPPDASGDDHPSGLRPGRTWIWIVGAAALALLGAAGALLMPAKAEPAPPRTAPSPSLAADGDTTGQVPWDGPLVVRVRSGHLRIVTVSDGGGSPLSGLLEPGSRVWRSAQPLAPGTRYSITAGVVDLIGRNRVRTLVVTTRPPRQTVSATITPGDGDVVGVGMPIVVRFDHAVSNAARAAIAQRIDVYTSPAVTGGWRWLSPTELHWRPASYWPAHTAVIATIDLTRLDLGGGSWGVGRHTSSFDVGDAHISTADAATHLMSVTDNGQLVRTLPMSAGRAQYPSHSGVHLALSKDPTVVMDSATVGIPRTSPDGYYETVAWDVRISYAGEFVHAAPWSVAAQGNRNVSHGCINLSPADAQWFYGFTQRGDIIDVLNAGASPNLADPGTADWNLSWDAWQTQPA